MIKLIQRIMRYTAPAYTSMDGSLVWFLGKNFEVLAQLEEVSPACDALDLQLVWSKGKVYFTAQ